MVTFEALMERYGQMGEKTGWVYIQVPAKIAQEIKPGTKVSYRLKGTIDQMTIRQLAIIPMGEGNYILPINALMRKKLRKEEGHTIKLVVEVDDSEFEISEDFLMCLADEPDALDFFESLSKSHQRYFSKWIESAKTIETKARRIAMAVDGLRLKMDYGAMIRANKK